MELAAENNPKVELVFTSSKGTKIYALRDILTISAFRGLAAEKAKRFSQMNISEKVLKELIQEYKKSVNVDQDFVKANSIIQEIEYRLEFICEENSLLDLASIYFFLEGENIEMPSDSFNKKKIEHAKLEFDVRSFFLRSALALTNKFSNSPEKDLLNYLEEIKMISERVYRYIRKQS